MEKQQILEVLSRFKTQNLMQFAQELSVKTIVGNPWIIGLLVVVFFFAVIKRSRFVLLFLFTLLSVTALVHYTLPTGVELTVTSFLPFAFGGIAICAVLIYLSFIKTE